MKLAHVSLWTEDLDAMALFWRRYFDAVVGEPRRRHKPPGALSRLVALPNGDQIELMTAPWLAGLDTARRVGWAHVAISLGSEAAVDALAVRLKRDRFEVGPAHRTGEGGYEAVVRGPGGVSIEIMA